MAIAFLRTGPRRRIGWFSHSCLETPQTRIRICNRGCTAHGHQAAHPADHCDPKSSVEINCPQIALRDVVRLVVSQVSELHKCSVCTRDTTTRQLCSQGLRNSTVRTSTSQRSHLLSCEHSWAEQTHWPSNNAARSEDTNNREKNRATSRSKADNTDRHSWSKVRHTHA